MRVAILTFAILLLIVIILYIFLKEEKDRKLIQTATSLDRGTTSELELVLMLLKANFSPKAIFHDLYLARRDGGYCQIDLVLPTKVGIIVFEVKDYSGWIFGNGDQKNWNQVLSYGSVKHRFYNPILQNRNHIFDLKVKLTQFDRIPFYSVVVFFGNCEFKKLESIPKNVFLCKSDEVIDVVNQIVSNNQPANYSNKLQIINLLRNAVNNGANVHIRERHISDIKKMVSKRRFRMY